MKALHIVNILLLFIIVAIAVDFLGSPRGAWRLRADGLFFAGSFIVGGAIFNVLIRRRQRRRKQREEASELPISQTMGQNGDNS